MKVEILHIDCVKILKNIEDFIWWWSEVIFKGFWRSAVTLSEGIIYPESFLLNTRGEDGLLFPVELRFDAQL